MPWFAEVDEAVGGRVARVIVAPTLQWCEGVLGGVWVEVFKYDPAPYAGPGQWYDPDWPQWFAGEWHPWDGTFDDAGRTPYQVGSVVYHAGQFWTSTTVDNVWEPGVSAWRPHPNEPGQPPPWVQPTGAHDAYRIYVDDGGVEHPEMVVHGGDVWVTLVDANVWEPGTDATLWGQVSVDG